MIKIENEDEVIEKDAVEYYSKECKLIERDIQNAKMSEYQCSGMAFVTFID
jgi:hypothetical protein